MFFQYSHPLGRTATERVCSCSMCQPDNRLPDQPASKRPATEADSHALLRTMGLFSLVVYGVGDMIGSGIYGTVGKAAGQLGNAVWLAFVISMVAALLTGLSYACLA